MPKPLCEKKCALFHALQPFEPIFAKEPVAIAVSGGSDSLALISALVCYFPQYKKNFHVLTLDHQLREASSVEGEIVRKTMATLGVSHTLLSWQGVKPQRDIMNRARLARYDLFENWMREHTINHIFLAHHLDDQWETILMRFLKKSGIDGLLGMRSVTRKGSIVCVRPFLSLTKVQLQDYLKKQGQTWSEDPTNHNMLYARSVARAVLQRGEVHAFMVAHQGDFSRLATASIALKYHFIKHHVHIDVTGFLWCAAPIFDRLPVYLKLDILRVLIQNFRGLAHPPKREKVERAFQNLEKGVTLGGCFIKKSEGRLFIARELAETSPIICCGTLTEWDKRFLISTSGAPPGAYFRSLGQDGWQILSSQRERKLDFSIPFPVILTLPSLWNNGMLLEVPHVDRIFSSDKSEDMIIQRVCVINRLMASKEAL